MTAFLHLTNAVLLLGLFVWSTAVWPSLPAEIPAHFGPDGQPTRWEERSLWRWFTMPIVALLLTTMNYGFAGAVRRWPRMVNLPDKERFLRLPEREREPVLALLRQMMYGISVPLLLVFGLIQYGTWRAALGEPSVGYMVASIVIAVLVTPLIAIAWLPRIQSAINRAEAKARENQAR